MPLGPRPKREPADLSESTRRRLDAYALAASVAGVSLLALVKPSEARVVYTRANHVIRDGHSFKLDLNQDGVTDLTLQNKFYTGSCESSICSHYQRLAARLSPSNSVVYNVFGAVAMKPGMRIGPRRPFHGDIETMAFLDTFASRGPIGSWLNVRNRYLGVKFKINGEIHYGWARLSVSVKLPLQITARLTGYAYETIANKSIRAGQTKSSYDTIVDEPRASLAAPSPKRATLGRLALGEPVLSILWQE